MKHQAFSEVFSQIFFLSIKMNRQTSAKYYKNPQKNKEKIQKKSRERYQNISDEEKSKKREYGRERYKNLTEDKK